MNADAGGQSEARLLDAVEVAVVVFDRDGKVVLANRRARDDLPRSASRSTTTALFTHSFELVDEHGELLPTAEFPAVRTLRTGEVLANFVMGLRSSGRGTAWVMIGDVAGLAPTTGPITAVICTFFDITEQRNAQQALRDVGGAVPAPGRERGRRGVPGHGGPVAAVRVREPGDRVGARLRGGGVLRQPEPRS